jgi:integrase
VAAVPAFPRQGGDVRRVGRGDVDHEPGQRGDRVREVGVVLQALGDELRVGDPVGDAAGPRFSDDEGRHESSAMAGVPARTIQELARHADIGTTQRNMHLVKDAKEDGIAKLAALRQ